MNQILNFLEKLFTSRISFKRLLRYALFIFLSLLAQNMVLNRVRILGVCPMILPAVVVAVAMFQTPVKGALFGLVLGFFADMAFVENSITFTVLFPALSFAAGFISEFFINRRFFAYMGAALGALLATGIVQMLLTAAGDSFSVTMIRTVLLQTLWALPFAAVAYIPAERLSE